jgi:tetratricopeptide (TPR) repeat protein
MWPRNLYELVPGCLLITNIDDAKKILVMQMLAGPLPADWEDTCKAYYICGNSVSKSLYEDLLLQQERQLSKELEDLCLEGFDQWFEDLKKTKKLAPMVLSFANANRSPEDDGLEAEQCDKDITTEFILDNSDSATEKEDGPETEDKIIPFLEQQERSISANTMDNYFYIIDNLIKKFPEQKNMLLQRVINTTLAVQKGEVSNAQSIELLEVAVDYAEKMMIDGKQNFLLMAALYHSLGRQYIKAGETDDALACYQSATNLYIENNTHVKAECLGEYAKICYDIKKWDEALVLYDRARCCLRKSPKVAIEKNIHAYDLNLLNCHYAIGERLLTESKKHEA